MSQNVMITGAGKAVGLGYNMVLRYLEAGDNVVATIRKPCAELEELKKQYGEKLTILTMDISSTASVQKAAEILRDLFEKKRNDFEGHRFITNLDEDYPF